MDTEIGKSVAGLCPPLFCPGKSLVRVFLESEWECFGSQTKRSHGQPWFDLGKLIWVSEMFCKDSSDYLIYGNMFHSLWGPANTESGPLKPTQGSKCSTDWFDSIILTKPVLKCFNMSNTERDPSIMQPHYDCRHRINKGVVPPIKISQMPIWAHSLLEFRC